MNMNYRPTSDQFCDASEEFKTISNETRNYLSNIILEMCYLFSNNSYCIFALNYLVYF